MSSILVNLFLFVWRAEWYGDSISATFVQFPLVSLGGDAVEVLSNHQSACAHPCKHDQRLTNERFSMDMNLQAFRLVQEATREVSPDRAKLASARKGGLKGGTARARSITPERRVEIAKKASAARWNKSQ